MFKSENGFSVVDIIVDWLEGWVPFIVIGTEA